MAESSRLRVSELRDAHDRRSFIESRRPRGYRRLADQLHRVADSLQSTNKKLNQADEMFESYKDLTQRQEEEITDLEHELEQSDYELEQTRARVKRQSVVQFAEDNLSSSDDTDISQRRQRHAENIATLVDRRRKAREKRLQDDLDDTTEELDKGREQLNRSLTDRRLLARKVIKMEGHLSKVEQHRERVMSDLEETTRELDVHVGREAQLRKQVADLKFHLNQAKQYEAERQSEVVELKQQHDETQRLKQRLIKQLEQTQIQLDKVESGKQNVEEKLKRSENDCSKLTEELEQVITREDILHETNKRLLEANRKTETDASSRQEKMKRSYNKALDMIRKYRARLQRVENKLRQCQESREEMQCNLEYAMEVKRRLQNDIDEGNMKLRQLQQTLANLQDECAAKSDETQESKLEFSGLRSKHKTTLDELAEMRKRTEKEFKKAKQLDLGKYQDLLTKCKKRETEARTEIAALRQEMSQAQLSHDALVSELYSELDRQTMEGENRVDDVLRNLRQEKQELSEEMAALKASLSDKQSRIDALKQQQAREQIQKRELQANIEKVVEEKAILQQKYGRLVRMYKMKNGRTGIGKQQATEELEQDLQKSQRIFQQFSADQETVLRAVASEVDVLVSHLAHDIHSGYPAMCLSIGTENDLRKWVTDMISKLKWLQQEIKLRLERDAVLRQQVTRGHQHAEELIQASEEDRRYFLSELSKHREMLTTLAQDRQVLGAFGTDQNLAARKTLQQLQEQAAQLTDRLEKGARALHASSAALREKQRLMEDLEAKQESRRARQTITDQYDRLRKQLSNFQT